MIRVLLEPGSAAVGRRVGLLEGEAHYLRVRRARDGDPVELRDGKGLSGLGQLILAGKIWSVEVTAADRAARPAELTLAVGSGDRDRFAWVVEKATELGVTSVIPLESARTAGVASRLRTQHVGRLQRHALEAVKQSGTAWATTVEEPLPLADLVARAPTGQGWVADAGGAPPPAVVGVASLTVVIGPEGGLTARELQLVHDAGYAPVCLGPHTLRFETAAIAAAAAATAARLRGSHG
ncbi:MAG: 16S rRNA (uracil(1498)-N(3))-methyltransferase [Gemmatimonadales bacterium]|nr:16S rRNA (uracil(1498)-N(3))-methyltransferase [Gemmatimonadales bacterium]